MGTSHSLEVGPPATARRVGDVLAHAAATMDSGTERGSRFEVPGAWLRSGLLVVTSAYTPPPFPSPIEEVFGFVPAAGVSFSPYQNDNAIEQRQDMIRLVVAVLTALPGDAWLAFEGEITRLVRIAGKVTISPEDGFWVPEVVDLLPPHDRAPLPNL